MTSLPVGKPILFARYQYMSDFLLSCTRPSLFLLAVMFVILNLSLIYCSECHLATVWTFNRARSCVLSDFLSISEEKSRQNWRNSN